MPTSLTGGNKANGVGTTDGFEFFMGQGGNDTIDGGGGYDRADYTASTTGASVTLGGSSNGTASDGLGGTDTLISIEAVRGSEYNDTLTGSDTGTFETFEGRARQRHDRRQGRHRPRGLPERYCRLSASTLPQVQPVTAMVAPTASATSKTSAAATGTMP
jgi:hypothetical protein